jgi:trehalose 6-phosphate phosphatase
MTPNLEGLCEQIASDYRRGRHLALFLDYDGTLVPIVEHPCLATLDRHTRRLLDRLARRPRVYVTIVSGRCLDDLKTLVPLRRLYFAGTGGMELDLGVTQVVHPSAERAAASVGVLVSRLKEEMTAWPGAWVEDKRLACTVHYRAVSPPLIATVCTAVQRIIACCRAPMVAIDGPMAIEITPACGWNKATAVHMVIEHLGVVDPVPLYAGDGANDAVALAAVTSMGGIAMGVGREAPAAGYRLAGPAAMREFLENLEDRLDQVPHGRKRTDKYLAMYGRWKPLLPTSFT